MINSLLDNDLYKFTMMMCVLHNFPEADVEYKLIVRSKEDLRGIKEEVSSAIDNLCSLKFKEDELDFLRGIRFLKPDFVYFLEDYTLKRKFVHVHEDEGQLAITVKGPWVQTILFEVPLLAILSEAFCKNKYPSDLSAEGISRLDRKIEFCRQAIENGSAFRFMDFGTRRRFSGDWHRTVVKTLSSKLPRDVFTGTSNLLFAKEFGLKPIGTMAHEYIQAGQGLGHVQLIKSQKYMLEKWAEEYRGDLGIALTDTIGMDAFLRDFDLYLAKLYDGCRQDSGDPFVWGEKIIEHYNSLGINPMTKVAVFSDNLNFELVTKIAERFKGRINTSFGIGTNLSNDLGVKPLSIVMKLVTVDGNPVAKISDEPAKAICLDPSFLDYLKKVFGV